MTRIASCQCRGFRVVVEAEADIVGICHCQICQRRTGVPLTCNAYFPKSKVRLEGEHRIYTRDCPEGRKLHNHFCPACGSTVGWTLDLRPNQFGVAVGRSEEHTSELQSLRHLVCRLLLDTASTETYTLSLHDALPIWACR